MLNVKRSELFFKADHTRVLLRPLLGPGLRQAIHVMERVLAIPEEQVGPLLASVVADFGWRHANLEERWLSRAADFVEELPAGLSRERLQLIGAFFSCEYSIESAALFNPSIVADPDQSGVAPGSLRFILSMRSTGEGHVSSITFRGGSVNAAGAVELDAPTRHVREPEHLPMRSFYHKDLFRQKLLELGFGGRFSAKVLDELPEFFTLSDLYSVDAVSAAIRDRAFTDGILPVVRANFEVEFSPEVSLGERVLFPNGPHQRNGIEDARFVQLIDAPEGPKYYATYTAYDGRATLPQLLETNDFRHFRFVTLNGPAVQNKGMALFPRKVQGHYAMLGRQDNENLFLMYSPNIHFWHNHKVIIRPRFDWELLQIGNCGSPLETEAGWLVLSHGVGPMRKYCVGAYLLDLKDPSRILARTERPLLEPDASEREGYVPNVVYSCGALIHEGLLILPYAVSDSAFRFATINVSDLLQSLV